MERGRRGESWARTALVALLMALAVPSVLAGCAGSQQLTGADKADKGRAGALAVFVNRKVTDELDAGKGDTVDWKYVDIPSAGEMVVTVAFDNPERVKGEVVLRDNFATVLERHRISADRSLYEFNTVQARKSRYYVEIAADNGSSVYTVGVALNDLTLGKFGTGQTSDFDRSGLDDTGGRRVGRVGGGGRKAGGGEASSEPDRGGKATDQVGAEGSTEGNAEDGGGEEIPADRSVTITGAIQRIIPLEEGGSLMHIYIGGEADQLAAGARGKVAGVNAVVVVRGRSGGTVTGVTKMDADDLKAAKSVTFTVKQ